MYIPFNKPFLTGKEAHYMYQAVYDGKISGNGEFTKRCQKYFEERYGFRKCLLTTSCTDALEMASILCDVKPGDEVIVPSYTLSLKMRRKPLIPIIFRQRREKRRRLAASVIWAASRFTRQRTSFRVKAEC